MRLVLKTDKFVVIDDFLPSTVHLEVWAVLGKENFMPAKILTLWNRNWSFDQGLPFATDSLLFSKATPKSYLEMVGAHYHVVAQQFPDLTGDWDDIRIHAQMYGRGTKINCHTDKHAVGSFTRYAHDIWLPHWGGELFFPSVTAFDSNNEPPKTIDRGWENDYLKLGLGQYIAPIPNRCILAAPGVFHSVNRVDLDAGDHMRCSVVGFLLAKDQKDSSTIRSDDYGSEKRLG